MGAVFLGLVVGGGMKACAERAAEAERARPDEIPVSSYLIDRLEYWRTGEIDATFEERAEHDRDIAFWIKIQAERLARTRGGSEQEWGERLHRAATGQGNERLVPRDPGEGIQAGPLTYRTIAILLLAWWLAQVLNGSAMSMHLARRRHPEWEWYLAHPVTQPPVFIAEALRPLVSNPNALASALSLLVLAGALNGSFLAGIAALPVALPFVFSAAVVAKATEVLVLLRSAPRSRGAWMTVLSGAGVMFWLLPIAGIAMPALLWWLMERLHVIAALLPSAELLLDTGSAIGVLRATAISLLGNAAICVFAAWAMAAASHRGLESAMGEQSAPAGSGLGARMAAPLAQVQEPLLRKELLWLSRDRGMLLQLVFVPLFLCGVYALNFSSALRNIEFDWARCCAVVAVFGTTLVTSASPRMLAGEGPALPWMLSWPRSLLDTVRIKAMVLIGFSGVVVSVASLGVMWLWPSRIPEIAMITVVTVLWIGIIAFKSITLVPGFSSSGEVLPPAPGRAMAVGLGNFSFAIGLFTSNWSLVVAALVMNATFAFALWTSLRDHLDFLFDPDSEPPPVPPTPLSALIAVVAYLELMAILTSSMTQIAGTPSPAGWLISSVLCGGLVAFYVWRWSRRYSVGFLDILIPQRMRHSTLGWASLGLMGGGLLGLAAVAYVDWLETWLSPELRQQITLSRSLLGQSGAMLWSLGLMFVVAAPVIEEYLFRGLLFRAFAHERSLRTAVLLSSAFFAVIHPMLAWPPVFLVGAGAALLFARAGNLLPAIMFHATYNAVVTGLPLLRVS